MTGQAAPAEGQARLSYLHSNKALSPSFARCRINNWTRIMFKLARGRPLAAALNTVKVCVLCLNNGRVVLTHPQASPVWSSLQQKRNLSIHEYLSANLLRSVRLLLWLSSARTLKNL